jgi:uncharacterized RDD family membrane protein YckC
MFHEIITSEKVPFTYRVAGLGSRFLAGLLDACLLLLLVLVGVVVGVVVNVGREGLGDAIQLLWFFVCLFGYFLLFEWLWLGQTPGKLILGIRVIQMDGASISLSQSTVRNLVRIVDFMPLLIGILPLGFSGVGMLTMLFNPKQRRLGDLAAGTLVVHQERATGAIRALRGAQSSADQARETLQRQRLEQLDRRQKQTVLDLCLRRDQLRIRTRTRLFRALAEYFRRELGLAPRQYESDEKFVLDLATVIGGVGASSPAVVAGLRSATPGQGPSLRSPAGQEADAV